MEKVITKVSELVNVLVSAKNGGQFASILGSKQVKFNQFPNEDYCKENGIVLASGKGSKALNEPYRFNGMKVTSAFSVAFHFGQDYEKTLERMGMGLSRSENGGNCDIEHFGGIAVGYPTTKNVCIVYMQGARTFNGYFGEDGEEITDSEKLKYIKGYKAKQSGDDGINYRTLSVRNIKTLCFGGNIYQVKIEDITAEDYEELRGLYMYRQAV